MAVAVVAEEVMKARRRRSRRVVLAAIALACVPLGGGLFGSTAGLSNAASVDKPEGEMRWALYVTIAPLWFDPGRGDGLHHALLGAVCHPRRAREAHARQSHGPQSSGIVDGERGSTRLRPRWVLEDPRRRRN